MRGWMRAAFVAALVSIAAPAARAQEGLDAAKAAGMVGERPDGLAGVVAGNAPGDVRALVDRVNAARLARYREVARSNGASLEQVQAVAGRRLIDGAPPGQYVQAPGRGWVRK